jgi:hypothetical protein
MNTLDMLRWLAPVFLAAHTAAGYAADLSPHDIVRQIDQRRLPSGGFEAELVIAPFKDGDAQEPGRYVVKANGDNQVLVEARNADQRGQKFLTTSSGIFFYAPRTKRAIRMTPLQTLRGQASIGDISRLHFAEDYDASRPDTVQDKCRDENCVVLELRSKSEFATYARILLTARRGREGYEAVSAELFLASGKQAKIVRFEPPQKNLPPAARYIDVINTRLETAVTYESIKPAKFPASMFNPRSLE